MAKITIDGVEYDTDSLTDEARAQLASLQFCDGELQRLQAEAASIQTARMAYAAALKNELERIEAGVVTGATTGSVGTVSEPGSKSEKKGLFGGLFGKK